MTAEPEALLPPGNAGIWSGISENLSFHASPESFLVNRILQYHEEHPKEVAKRRALRAKILNRNVIIISAFDQIKELLDPGRVGYGDEQSPPFVATAPYDRLMMAFFPPPNLLLKDGCPHAQMKDVWKKCAFSVESRETEALVIDRTTRFSKHRFGNGVIDLYDVLKDLAWQLFLSVFLDLEIDDPKFQEYQKLQEYYEVNFLFSRPASAQDSGNLQGSEE